MSDLTSALEKDSSPARNAVPGTIVHDAPSGGYALPDDALILIPVRNLVMFPGMILPVTLGREASIAAAQAAVKAERPVGLLLQRNPESERPGPEDLCRLGTLSTILRYVTTPEGSHHVVCQGQTRFQVLEFLEGYPFLVARVERIAEPSAESSNSRKEIEARFLQLKGRAT